MRQRAARTTTKADESPEFVAFWDAWRKVMNKNDGRGSARDEFVRHVEVYGAEPQDIVDGAVWFIRQGGNSEFKLHAQTWLNRRAYEDGAEMERSYQAKLVERQQQSEQPKVVQMPQKQTAFMREWAKRQAQG